MKTLNRIIESAQLIEVNNMVNLFRITNIQIDRQDNSIKLLYRATIYGNGVSLNVTWIDNLNSHTLKVGMLVRVEWLTKRITPLATSLIWGMKVVETLNYKENISNTIPRNWLVDGFATGALFEYINQLSWEYQKVIWQVLLDQDVLYHFIKAPVTINGKYSQLGGNLEKVTQEVTFLRSTVIKNNLESAMEVLIAATILVGIGRYNQFHFDTANHVYRAITTLHRDPRIMGAYLVIKAATRLNIKNCSKIQALENVIRTYKFV